jgi:hypothetical protein
MALQPGLDSSKTDAVKKHAIGAAAALVLALSFVACKSDEVSSGGAASASTGSSAATTMAENLPSGSPAPAKLQGVWRLVSLSGTRITKPLYVAISDREYSLRGQNVSGNLVVNDTKIAFYNDTLCVRGMSETGLLVGLYRWALRARTLHFRRVGPEPCRHRRGLFDDATYERLG